MEGETPVVATTTLTVHATTTTTAAALRFPTPHPFFDDPKNTENIRELKELKDTVVLFKETPVGVDWSDSKTIQTLLPPLRGRTLEFGKAGGQRQVPQCLLQDCESDAQRLQIVNFWRNQRVDAQYDLSRNMKKFYKTPTLDNTRIDGTRTWHPSDCGDEDEDEDDSVLGSEQLNPRWQECFQRLATFQQRHGHCNVTTKMDKTIARWVKSQRAEFKADGPLDNSRENRRMRKKRLLLESLGFDFDPQRNEKRWHNMLVALKKYREIHGHHEVTEKQDKPLCCWVRSQRSLSDRNKLDPERKQQLLAIGFDFSRPKRQLSTRASCAKKKSRKQLKGGCAIDHINRQIARCFDDLPYFGTVVAMDDAGDEPLWTVVYQGHESEELTYQELERGLKLFDRLKTVWRSDG
mmetsp:Transcript_5691/g.8018  ORF Transcript_5691/g.8018 Transcript_5691/m.8018 type:complete len:407 (-) Transcript_5691:2965-4185(-)